MRISSSCLKQSFIKTILECIRISSSNYVFILLWLDGAWRKMIYFKYFYFLGDNMYSLSRNWFPLYESKRNIKFFILFSLFMQFSISKCFSFNSLTKTIDAFEIWRVELYLPNTLPDPYLENN